MKFNMRKKLNTLILLTIGILFILVTPSLAKEMTVTELEKELEESHPNASYAYIIGEYIFTSDSNIMHKYYYRRG